MSLNQHFSPRSETVNKRAFSCLNHVDFANEQKQRMMDMQQYCKSIIDKMLNEKQKQQLKEFEDVKNVVSARKGVYKKH